MKAKNYFKVLCVALALCLTVCGLVACGAKTVALTVKDMGESTEIEATTGKTVAEALTEANITLATKDETEPAQDTKITEDLKEITVKRYAKVTVVNGTEKKEVELVGGTVEDAVKESGFTVTDDIKPDVPMTDYLKDGMTISLVKGVKIELTVDGKTTEITTFMGTIQDMLKEQNITMGKDDVVSEDLTAKPTEGMKITVYRVTYKEEKVTESVPFETEEKYSDSLEAGTTKVTQEGADGEKEVTYKVRYVDGKEDGREMVSETVTKEPVKKIVTKSSASGSNDSGSNDSGSNDSGSNDSGSNDSGSNDTSSTPADDSGDVNKNNNDAESGRVEVNRTDVPDCDGSGHGYYIVDYSDGSREYEEY